MVDSINSERVVYVDGVQLYKVNKLKNKCNMDTSKYGMV